MPSIPREVPAPPTLRKIVKSFPYPGNRPSSKKRDSTATSPISQVYPELSTLSSADIATDLDYLFQHRRPQFDPHSHRLGMTMTVSGPQMGPAATAGAMPHGGFDGYGMNVDGGGASPFASGSRMPPAIPQYQHHPSQQPLQQFPSAPGRPQHHPSLPQAPPSLHSHNQAQFSLEPEVTLVAVGPGQHQYFSGPTQGTGGAPSQMHHLGINRPISPAHVGTGGSGGKQDGWVGDGRMSGAHHSGNKQGPEYGWMSMHEGMDDVRDRDRDKRERERERDRLRERSDRDRERDQRDFERDRAQDRGYLMQQQAPHRHAPPHQHQHPHNTSTQPLHHHQGPHHHHRHHHHVLHHHHPQQLSGSGPSAPPLAVSPGPPGPGTALSPRVAPSRDFESNRPYPGPNHPSEVLNLSTPKQANSPSHWKRDELSSSDYREIRGRHGSRPSSTHPGPGLYEERERPLATPFAMASIQAMSSAGASGPPNGQSGTTVHSPRLPWSEEQASRVTPSSFPPRGSPLALSPPRNRPPAPRSPSSSLPFPMRSPTRYAPSGPTEPPMHSLSSTHGPLPSAPTSPGLKARRLSSPPPTKPGMIGGPSLYSPRLSGPGGTPTSIAPGPVMDTHNNTHPTPGPSTSTFNRTSSPLMTFNSGQVAVSSRPPNGNTTILPAPKMNAVQMVDGP